MGYAVTKWDAHPSKKVIYFHRVHWIEWGFTSRDIVFPGLDLPLEHDLSGLSISIVIYGRFKSQYQLVGEGKNPQSLDDLFQECWS